MEIHLLFLIVIFIGLAFGIYGVVIQRGANLIRTDARMAVMSLIWGTVQLGASLAGYETGSWILRFELERERSIFWIHILAGVIFAGIGIRMLLKAFQKKTYLEHRMENLDIREDIVLALRLCIHAFFTGIACALLRFSLPAVMICAFVITAASAVGGYISGQIWGAEPSGKAYAIGGGLLCLVSVALQVVEKI